MTATLSFVDIAARREMEAFDALPDKLRAYLRSDVGIQYQAREVLGLYRWQFNHDEDKMLEFLREREQPLSNSH